MPHIEITREIARRFNHLYGRDRASETRPRRRSEAGCQAARMYHGTHRLPAGTATTRLWSRPRRCSTRFRIPLGDRERLYGYLEGSGKMILVEPGGGLLPWRRACPAWTGRRCPSPTATPSTMRAKTPRAVTRKVRTMQTDPARVRRTDPATSALPGVAAAPDLFRRRRTLAWVQQGCRRGHRLPGVQAAGAGGDPEGAGGAARARPALSGRSRRCCAASSPTAASARAGSRRRPCATCARRWV